SDDESEIASKAEGDSSELFRSGTRLADPPVAPYGQGDDYGHQAADPGHGRAQRRRGAIERERAGGDGGDCDGAEFSRTPAASPAGWGRARTPRWRGRAEDHDEPGRLRRPGRPGW